MWNPSPKVDAAKDFGKKFGKDMVIILSVDQEGRLEYVSYGENKYLCDQAQELADKAFDAIMKE